MCCVLAKRFRCTLDMKTVLLSSCPSCLLALRPVTEQVHQGMYLAAQESFIWVLHRHNEIVGSCYSNFTLSLRLLSIRECVLTCNT